MAQLVRIEGKDMIGCDCDKKSSKVRDFIKFNFYKSLKFYDNLDIVDKRKYFIYVQRTDNPLPPDKWFVKKEYKRYEYSFVEIASILKITKQEAIIAYMSAMKKLRFMVSDAVETEANGIEYEE